MSAIAEFIDTLEDKIENLQKMKSLERNNQDLKNELIKNENHTKSIHGD
jgi:cell shape-determining protein MreC